MRDEELIERFVSEETLFDGKVVHLRRMTVTLPNGREALREVVRHIGASAVVPLDDAGNVIMVRQFRVPFSRVLLEIPAGKLDSRDEDRLLAAQRELEEETGYTAKTWVKLTDMVSSPGFCDECISIYLATGLTRGADHRDEDEFLNTVAIPFSEALSMAGSGEITDSKTLCGLLLAARYLEKQRKNA